MRDLGDVAPYKSYGKMRSQSYGKYQYSYYRCTARSHGYECSQRNIRVEKADAQVVQIIKHLHVKTDWRERVSKSISDILGESNVEERLVEIRKIIARMDTRWDHGFITNEQEYLTQRLELQQQMERLKPVPDSELEHAVHLLTHFGKHWDKLDGQPEEQHKLLKLIVKRVYLEGDEVVAMTLVSNLHLVLGGNEKGPTEISIDPFVTSGIDGI